MVLKNIPSQSGIRDRVVNAIPYQFIVLNQTVIRILGKGQRREIKGIHNRQSQQPEIGTEAGEDRQVMMKNVVSENKCSPVDKAVKLGQGLIDVTDFF